MATSLVGPRKKRTRQHVIADLSVHHVEGFILEEGHTAQRLGSDYGYDLIMNTFDQAGYAEPGPVYFQLKAMENLRLVGDGFVYDMDVRDYHLWIREEVPVIFVLFEASRRKAFWLCVQEYFAQENVAHPKRGAKSVRLRFSQRSRFDRAAVHRIKRLKSRCSGPTLGVLS